MREALGTDITLTTIERERYVSYGIDFHATHADSVQVHSNSLPSGNVTIGVTAAHDDPEDGTTEYISITGFLRPQDAQDLYNALGVALAQQELTLLNA